MQDKDPEIIKLGDIIQLSGFKIIEPGEMVIIRKLVGSQVRKFQEMVENFERLTIHLKPVHKTEQNMIYELHADLIHSGKNLNVQAEARNLFMALSDIFRKLEEIIIKKK